MQANTLFYLTSDVDECAPPAAPCAHYCTNTVGSYYCHCNHGFQLEGSSTCVATGKETFFPPYPMTKVFECRFSEGTCIIGCLCLEESCTCKFCLNVSC